MLGVVVSSRSCRCLPPTPLRPLLRRAGINSTYAFEQTKRNLVPLYDRLKHRQISDELLTGLWMMVQAMRSRNYLHANDIYLKLAIGNAPWPIGVTSVGIHERSAREKISHVMNSTSHAHIMNDEATRKYFQVGLVGGGTSGWGAARAGGRWALATTRVRRGRGGETGRACSKVGAQACGVLAMWHQPLSCCPVLSAPFTSCPPPPARA